MQTSLLNPNQKLKNNRLEEVLFIVARRIIEKQQKL